MLVPDHLKQKITKGYIKWKHLNELPNQDNQTKEITIEYY